MSIMTWKCEMNEDDDAMIVVDYPDNEEMAAVIELVETALRPVTREGFNISCDGNCNKAPQGINWTVRIAFESVAMANVAAQAMQARYGQPEGMSVAEFALGQQRQLERG